MSFALFVFLRKLEKPVCKIQCIFLESYRGKQIAAHFRHRAQRSTMYQTVLFTVLVLLSKVASNSASCSASHAGSATYSENTDRLERFSSTILFK